MQRIVLFVGLVIGVGVVVGVQTVRADKAHQHHFVGIHPIPKGEGGGICYIEGPHIHVYVADKLQYRDHEGASYFVGDPVAYGYDGPHHAYKGHHPIHVEAALGEGDPEVVYCYLDGPHFHNFEPPPGPDFKVVGGAYFFVGEPPHAYLEARPAMIAINAEYRPLVYTRPVIEVDAPVGWIGARVDVGGPRVDHAAVGVGVGVGADIHVVVPSIHIGIGVPGVVIQTHDNGRHRGHR